MDSKCNSADLIAVLFSITIFVTLSTFAANASAQEIFVTGHPGGGTDNTIGVYTISGAPINDSLVSLQNPYSIAISGTNLFFADNATSEIELYTTGGTLVNPSFAPGPVTSVAGPNAIAVSGGNLFIANRNIGTISEYTTSGTLVNASLISGLNGPAGIAVSGGELFVIEDTSGTVGAYDATSAERVNDFETLAARI